MPDLELFGRRSGDDVWRVDGWQFLDRSALAESGLTAGEVEAAERAVLSGDTVLRQHRAVWVWPLTGLWLLVPVLGTLGALVVNHNFQLVVSTAREPDPGFQALLRDWLPSPDVIGWFVTSVIVMVSFGFGIRGLARSVFDNGVLPWREQQLVESPQQQAVQDGTTYVPLADREGDLLQRALRAARRVQGSTAWGSDFLQSHRLTMDLVEETRQLRYRTAKVHQLRQSAAVPGVDRATQKMVDKGIKAALDGIETRVNALESYSCHVDAVDQQILRLEELQRSEELAEGLVAQINDVVALTAIDHTVAEHLDSLGQDARAVSEGLQEAIALIRGDLHLLAVTRSDPQQ